MARATTILDRVASKIVVVNGTRRVVIVRLATRELEALRAAVVSLRRRTKTQTGRDAFGNTALEVLVAGARNQRYLQLWSGAA